MKDRTAIALLKKQALLPEATQSIASLQDAVDLGIETEAEKQQLITRKQHRVLLNRIDITKASVFDWPHKPAQ